MTDQHLTSTGGPGGRLARFASGKTSKWLILGFWLVVFVVALSPAGKLTGAQENDAVSWLPGDAESTSVLRDSAAFQSSDEIPAVVVYERSSGATNGDIAAVAAQMKQFADIDGVQRDPVGPIPSEDKRALQVLVPIDAGSGGWEALGTAVDEIRTITDDGPAGLSVHITGPGGFAADSSEAFAGIDGKLLYSAVGVVVVILLLTYRSPLLWMLPVFSAVVSLIVAQAAVYFLATQAGLTVNAQSAGILTVLVFGAGTDYALLLVARYREELRRHEDRHEAMAFALHRSGPAIFASGSTVDRRDALPALRQHELHAGTRTGRRRRHRGRPPRHAHAAPGPAGDHGPLVLLAGASVVRLGRPTRRPGSGHASAGASPAPRAAPGSSPRWCSRSRRSGCSSSTPTACRTRTRSTAPPTRSSARKCWPGTSRRARASRSW